MKMGPLRPALFCGGLGESLGFEPEIKFFDPVIAPCALLFHAEAVAAGTVNVGFRSVARSHECLVELRNGVARQMVVLRPGHKDRREVRRNRRHNAKGRTIDRCGEIRTRRRVGLKEHSASNHASGRESHETQSGEIPFLRYGILCHQGKLLGRNRQLAGLPHPPCPCVGQSLLFRPWA